MSCRGELKFRTLYDFQEKGKNKINEGAEDVVQLIHA